MKHYSCNEHDSRIYYLRDGAQVFVYLGEEEQPTEQEGRSEDESSLGAEEGLVCLDAQDISRVGMPRRHPCYDAAD